MKNAVRSLCLVSFTIYALSTARADTIDNGVYTGDLSIQPDSAASPAEAGNLSISGVADIFGNTLNLGTAGSNPGISITYTDDASGQTTTITMAAARTTATWRWQQNSGGGMKNKMVLDQNNVLTILSPNYFSGNAGKIVLTPNTGGSSITIDGSALLTASAAAATYLTQSAASSTYLTQDGGDARYVFSSGMAAGSNSAAMSSGYAAGTDSTAMSYGYTNGNSSTAMSQGQAYGDASTAISSGFAYGQSSVGLSGGTAFADFSTAMSDGAAYGLVSTAIGPSDANGDYSTSMGGSEAGGIYSTAMSIAEADGDYSTAMSAGYASGSYSTAMSLGQARGDYSTAIGGSVSKSYGEVTIGQYNLLASNPSATSWVATDNLFVVGNGTNPSVRSNALTIYKNGNATFSGSTITIQAPNYSSGNTGKIVFSPSTSGSSVTVDGNALLTASTAAATYITQGSADSRYALGSNFTATSVTQGGTTGPAVALAGAIATAPNSFAGVTGYASGASAMALGNAAHASGVSSFATGNFATASGGNSIALGADSTASGGYAMASGGYSTASGWSSTAAGFATTAAGYTQFVIGQYNVSQGNPNSWISTDDLFEIGNGTDDTHRSNAFVVKKNGDTSISGTLNLGKNIQGGQVVASGTNSIVLGGLNDTIPTQVTGNYDIALGGGCTINSHCSLSMGQGNETGPIANYSLNIGQYNGVTSWDSVVIGVHGTVSGHAAVGLGVAPQVYGLGQVAVGLYNVASGDPNITDPAQLPATAAVFIVGNGSPTVRSNAMTVYKSGDVTVQGVVKAAAGGDIPMFTGN